MNGVDFLSGAFGRGIDKITNIVGKWGSSQPVDDSKSGIKIGDKIYQVVVSLNGCYWYLDEEGKKHPVSGIPATTEWGGINIAEKPVTVHLVERLKYGVGIFLTIRWMFLKKPIELPTVPIWIIR